MVLLVILAPADAGDLDQDRAWEQLERVITDAEPVRALHARFEQRKLTALLRNPITSSGTVQHAEGVTRWDTSEPYASVMVVTEGKLELYYPEQGVLEVYELGDAFSTMALSPAPDLEELRRMFEVRALEESDEVLTVTLVPAAPETAEVLSLVVMEVDRRLACLHRVEFTNPDDEVTTIRFDAIELNPDLDREALRMDVPEDTTVVYPLGDAARGSDGGSD